MRLSLLPRSIGIVGVLACLSLVARAEPPRDGSHDFDFARGEWHTHVTRVLDPFAGGTHTVTIDGTKTARPVWGGRPGSRRSRPTGRMGTGKGRVSSFTMPRPVSGASNILTVHKGDFQAPSIGGFKDGRGEFFATETYQDRTVLVRGVWLASSLTRTVTRFPIRRTAVVLGRPFSKPT